MSYERVADYIGGGDLEASVTVPARAAALARTILSTLRLPY